VETRRLRPARHGTLRVREPAAGTLAVLLNLPAGLVLLAVLAWPVLYAGWLSLHTVSLRQLRADEFPFTGLANYIRLFGDEVFWLALRHTVVFVAVSVVLEVAIGLAIALVIDDERVVLSRVTRVLVRHNSVQPTSCVPRMLDCGTLTEQLDFTAVAIIVSGFPSRRSEPGYPHAVVLVAASW
jgi:ABC-type polysaccharide transport system permease subunit